jgi:hypothetical protein
MNIQRLKEIEQLGVSPSELLEYALIKNNSIAIAEAIREHDLHSLFELDEPDPEEALTFAIDNLAENILTTLLRPHGYQPIPKRKQAKREKALSH